MFVIIADHLDILHVWHVCWYMELVNRAHGQLAATVATKRIHITSPREEAVTAPARVIPTEILRTAVRNVGNLHTHTSQSSSHYSYRHTHLLEQKLDELHHVNTSLHVEFRRKEVIYRL